MSNNPFKIKEKPCIVIDVAQYMFRFYFNEKNLQKGRKSGTYLKISSKVDSQFGFTIPGNTDAYGFLYAAAKHGDHNQLSDYARVIFSVSMLLTTDQTFADGICKAIVDWQERRMADGAKQAQEVTDEQEQVAQTFMEDVAEFADSNNDERNKIREDWKQEIKEIIEEDGSKTESSGGD